MVSIGERLREERERLGMNQSDFASIGALTKRALSRYENGERSPDAAFLAAIAVAGADVLYILTGQRSAPVAPQALLPASDRALLDDFHAAPPGVQAGVKATLAALSPAPRAGRKKAS